MSDPYGLLTMRDFEEVAKIVEDLRTENTRLREAIRRLAGQDATLSVCGGNVIVEMDATLTPEEREAIDTAEASLMRETTDMRMPAAARKNLGIAAATLRGLLARTAKRDTTPTRNGTPSEGSVPERDTSADDPPPDPERFNEWLRRPYYVDPPQGWRYGFPKLYDPAKDGNMTEWLIANGYPETLARKGLPCTFTACTDSQ